MRVIKNCAPTRAEIRAQNFSLAQICSAKKIWEHLGLQQTSSGIIVSEEPIFHVNINGNDTSTVKKNRPNVNHKASEKIGVRTRAT